MIALRRSIIQGECKKDARNAEIEIRPPNWEAFSLGVCQVFRTFDWPICQKILTYDWLHATFTMSGHQWNGRSSCALPFFWP